MRDTWQVHYELMATATPTLLGRYATYGEAVAAAVDMHMGHQDYRVVQQIVWDT